MATNVKALREQLGADAKVIRELADKINAESRDFNSEEQAQWDAVNKAYNDKEKRLVAIERADAVQSRMSAVQPEASGIVGGSSFVKAAGGDGASLTDKSADLAFNGWLRYQAGFEPSQDEQEAAEATGVVFRRQSYDIQRPQGIRQNSFWSVNGKIGATMSQWDPTTGGVTVPTTLIRSLEAALLQFGGVRQVAEVMTTATGETIAWPTANDTSNSGRRINEGGTQTTTTTTNPSFGAVMWNAYAYTSDFILIPYGLLRDSAFDLASVVGGMLGERVGRKTNTDFTTGPGAAAPKGIVTASTLGVTAASATAIAADELYDLVHSVDPSYRGMGCGWMLHDSIFLALRKLKDGNGRYLWQEGMSVGAPNMLLSFPYVINQDMQASIASATKTILYGLMSKYKIRDVAGVRLNRVNERFIENDLIGFNYISYHDGNLLDAGTHPVKHLLQAT